MDNDGDNLFPPGSTTANSSVSRPHCPPMERSALSGIKRFALLEHGGRALLSTSHGVPPSIPGRASLTHLVRSVLWSSSIAVIDCGFAACQEAGDLCAARKPLFPEHDFVSAPKHPFLLDLLVAFIHYRSLPYAETLASERDMWALFPAVLAIHCVPTFRLSARPLGKSQWTCLVFKTVQGCQTSRFTQNCSAGCL